MTVLKYYPTVYFYVKISQKIVLYVAVCRCRDLREAHHVSLGLNITIISNIIVFENRFWFLKLRKVRI